MRFTHTHFVKAFNCQHRAVSSQLQDLVPFVFIGEYSLKLLDYLLPIVISGLELLQGVKDV